MQQTKFFNTQSEDSPFTNALLQKKKQMTNYVSKLDFHINKAKNFQDRALGRKKQNLLHTLEKMKDQIYRQTERTRKMQEFFQQNCQNILKQDISKWDFNKEFFTKMFDIYDLKINEKRKQIDQKKRQIDYKSRKLKQLMKRSRKVMTIEQLNQKLLMEKKKQRDSSKQKKTIQTQDTTTRVTRVKTQVSLPSLNKPTRVKTSADDYEDQFKNYMKPIKTEKSLPNPQLSADILQMMNWYKIDRLQDYNWFQKLIFVDRNFKKITDAFRQ